MRDAIYLPWSDNGSWGVFDGEGRLIPESISYRGTSYSISGPVPSFSANNASTAVEAEIDTLIYVGVMQLHYGHFLVNSLPRLWPVLDDRCPPLLCHFQGERESFQRGFTPLLLAPLGLSIAEFHAPPYAIRIKRLLIPETSFHEQMGVNTVYRVMCKKIGRAYCDERDHDAGPPIYLSKTRLTSGVGRFVGEQEVVDILERDGVQIVYPEELTVSEQIQLISRSRVVAGTSGSALHTSIFSAFGRRIIALNQNDDVNSNFVMIDRLVGNSASYYFAPQSRSKKGSSFLTDHTLEDPAKVGSSLLRIIREQD